MAMPKVMFGKAAEAREMERRNTELIRALNGYRGYNEKLKRPRTMEEMVRELGIGKNTLVNLFHGRGAHLSLEQWWRVLDAAGYEVRRKEIS